MTPHIRALTPDETRALAAARLVAIEHAPYLAHALFTMHPVAAEGLGTFAVDRSWRLYLDPTTMADWGPQLSGGVLIHEAGHLIRDHAGRADALDPLHHTTWNYATDAAINDGLTATGIPLPDGVVTPDALGLPTDGIEETYYHQLIHTLPASAAQDDAEGGCGSGAGDPVAGWELPTDTDLAPGIGEGRARITRHHVAQEIRRHAAGTGPGTVPGGWQRWASDTLAAPTVPWQRVLGSAVRRAVAWTRGRRDYTYTRPGRRHIPGIVTPAMRTPQVNAAVVVDTSASMGQPQLDAALAEVRGVIRATGVGPRGLAVLSCDAQVGATTRVRRVEEVTIVGGGGTDMRVGIGQALALRPAPDVVVVLTDGYTPWPAAPVGARLVIAVIGTGPIDTTPSWAMTVRVDPGSTPAKR